MYVCSRLKLTATAAAGISPAELALRVARTRVLFGAFSTGCGQKQAAGNEEPPAVAVKTAVIEPVPISESSEYLGTLKSRHSVVLNPQVEGQITNIFVRSGDRVKAGTALMQIDPIKQQATVGSQEAARAAQEASVRFAADSMGALAETFRCWSNQQAGLRSGAHQS